MPKLRVLHVYVAIWVVTTFVLAREYAILNGKISGTSLLSNLAEAGWFGKSVETPLDPTPGKPWSYRLGWVGFLTICMTNLYILRKRLPAMQTVGKVSRWLDFHIFCGLMGPTIIVFHSNFQVRGLVSISFWCMMISFLSGIVGRYFYVQVLRQRSEMRAALKDFEAKFQQLEKLDPKAFSKKRLHSLKFQAYQHAGGSLALDRGEADLLTVLWQSIVGDIRVLLFDPPYPAKMPSSLRKPLKTYGLIRRRLAAIGSFRRLMGYWHSFHMPFAVFMYLVTIIHIASALIFRVNR